MTRETKIGLLVGMGFIVLFGIILSEAGSRRRGMIAPQYAATDTVGRLAPRADIAVLAQDSSSFVAEVKQPRDATADQLVVAWRPAPETAAARQLAASSPGQLTPKPAIEHTPPPAVEPVSVLEPEPQAEVPEATPAEPVIPPALPASAVSIYVVKKNDNLTRIACTVLGTASPEAVEAIYEANRNDLKSINHLRVGQKLRIPESLDSTAQTQAHRHADRPADDGGVPKRLNLPYKWYQIKQNDTWSSIAQHELGDRARWHELYELNRGKFPNPNWIRPGVRIKVPADASG